MRARNIKPGFFNDEELLELPPLTRILFAGLWCLADRVGRLPDKPRRIKIEVLPCDDFDVDAALQSLYDHGLIVRYEVDGARYIQVENFLKHQHPHVSETASTIPAPDVQNANLLLSRREHHASTMQAPGEHHARPADSGSLIPDSGSLIPDSGSLIPDSGLLIRDGVTGVASAPPRTKTARFVKPSIEEVRAYCAERKNSVDPERWMAYYESNGWRVGKNPMKDWRAAVRTWERGDNNGRTATDLGGSGKPAGAGDLPGTRSIPGMHEF